MHVKTGPLLSCIVVSRFCLAVLSMVLVVVAGCGGGTSGITGGGGVGSTPSTVPILKAIAPSAVSAGSPGMVIVAYGSNFKDGVTLNWNGTPLPTTCTTTTPASLSSCSDDTEVTASIPASDLATAGNVTVTLSVAVANIAKRVRQRSVRNQPHPRLRLVPDRIVENLIRLTYIPA